MGLFGTKCCNDSAHSWWPEVLSSIFKEIENEHGSHALLKPLPGNEYRKRYYPLSDIDRPSFRRLPELITVISPPRLFLSNAYKYHGRFYMECEHYWQFEYKYPWDQAYKTDWMPVRLLSYCYINATCVGTLPKPIACTQLSLF